MISENLVCINDTTVTLSPSASSVRGTAQTNARGTNATSVLIYNYGPNLVFVKSGDSTVTAAATDLPVPVGAIYALAKSDNHTHVAAYCAGASTVYVTASNGA